MSEAGLADYTGVDAGGMLFFLEVVLLWEACFLAEDVLCGPALVFAVFYVFSGMV